jgi:hypothetical protein
MCPEKSALAHLSLSSVESVLDVSDVVARSSRVARRQYSGSPM